MSTFKIDSQSGFDLSSGNLEFAYDAEAIAIDCQVTAQQLLGENPFNVLTGVDWIDIFSRQPNLLNAENKIRDALEGVAGVESLTDYKSAFTGDTLSYEIQVNGITQDVVTTERRS